MAVRTYRDRLLASLPPWLQLGNNAKLMYALGVQLDAMADALIAGVRARYPGAYGFESLPYIGRERRIRRGLLETDASYAARLIRWLDDHRRRGGPYALLAQLHAFYAPNNFPIDLVYRNGRRFRMDVAGNIARDDIDFRPDTWPARWARWWLFYWTDAYLAPNADELATLKLVPQEWNSAHALGVLHVMPTGAELLCYPPEHAVNESGLINRPGPSATIVIE